MVGGVRHHGYPLFLGGSNSQPAFVLESVEAHNAAHNYLAERGLAIQNPEAAQRVWRGLSQARRREIIEGSLRAAGVPQRLIDANIKAIMRGATPGTAVTRAAGYPGGLVRVGARRGAIAAELLTGIGALACNPYALAVEEILLNPTPTAGQARFTYEMPVFPPSSPDLYSLPRGTIILPNGQIYIPLPESEFGPSDFVPPPGSLVVIQSGRVIGQSVRAGATYPPGSVASASSLPWILYIPENVAEDQARNEYLDYLQYMGMSRAQQAPYIYLEPEYTFAEWLQRRYRTRR
jgi:hypothetical protein